MTGQEARDDEREALIEKALRDAMQVGIGWLDAAALDRWVEERVASLFAALARKHPEPEITEEMVNAASLELSRHEDYRDSDYDIWRCRCNGRASAGVGHERAIARASLEAALRVPVGEGKQ